MRGRTIGRLAIAAAVATAGVLAVPGAAFASGGEHGVLRIHGPGTTYAGSNAAVAIVTKPLQSASFPFQVKNTGTATAQYNFDVSLSSTVCSSECGGATVAVTSGSLILTTLAQGPNGYYTAPIDPGKTASYTLKLTMPSHISPNDGYAYTITLRDTAGTFLDTELAVAEIASTTGTTNHDEFVSGAGQQPLSGEGNVVSAPSLAIGASTNFTVKLMNNSSTATQIPFVVSEPDTCNAHFPLTVKSGLTDITTQAIQGYHTPSLAPGKSLTLTVTIKYASVAPGCGYDIRDVVTGTSGNETNIALIVNPAAV
jgi:uncharacterized cupredoxin-like copper-binding protein